ncbi:MAG: response regulator transcription factor [Okeania sp. SIO2H7]|nr:response regulator transcription factor [Okeania sp. SIO2H7]
MRILLTEDDHRLSKQLVRVLTRENYIVDAAFDSKEALELIEIFPYNLLILDIILPGVDGITLCRQLRDRHLKIPILLLTVKNTNEDKVKAFDAGADDYLVKPFNLPELLARIRALLRRNIEQFVTALEWQGLCLNPTSRQVTYQDKKINLTITEYQIIELFLHHKHKLFSCGDIIEHLYFFENPPAESTIRSHIRGLRKKLKNAGCNEAIATVHGFGYRLKTEEQIPRLRKEQTKEALVKSWQEFKDSIFLDVAFLEEVAMELKQTSAASIKLSEAIRVAHNLVGILGSLGRHQAALISLEIENLLEDKKGNIGEKLVELRGLLTEEYPPKTSDLEESVWYSKIMAIDEDRNFLSEMQSILEQAKLEVYPVTSLLNFWETLERVSPDLLIVDLKMPDLDGIELCQLIRQKPRYLALPILVISSDFNEENLQQLVTAGADDFMRKSALNLELKYRVLCLLQRFKQLTINN